MRSEGKLPHECSDHFGVTPAVDRDAQSTPNTKRSNLWISTSKLGKKKWQKGEKGKAFSTCATRTPLHVHLSVRFVLIFLFFLSSCNSSSSTSSVSLLLFFKQLLFSYSEYANSLPFVTHHLTYFCFSFFDTSFFPFLINWRWNINIASEVAIMSNLSCWANIVVVYCMLKLVIWIALWYFRY